MSLIARFSSRLLLRVKNSTIEIQRVSKNLEQLYKMANNKVELNELFAVHPVTELPPDVLGELQSILRLHSITPQELLYKWESYSMKMGMDQGSLDLGTARALKKDLQEMLERDSRGKAHMRSADKKAAYATPRAGKDGDVFGMLVCDDLLCIGC